jgi:hypothetical protein
VGEPKPSRQPTLRLEYRFDRLLPDKLAQAYQLLVPDQRRPIGVEGAELPKSIAEMNNEQASRHLRSRVL